MKILINTLVIGLLFLSSSLHASSGVMNHYKTLTKLNGDWKLSPASQQEGGATKKGPAAKLLNTDKTAMSFKVIGKGSTVQENLLPGTKKEMATMYHCNDFDSCNQVAATHYCAKQNQPQLVLDTSQSSTNKIVMKCNMDTALCNSPEGHVHMIKHELSNNNNLKTSYVIHKDNKLQKTSVYHFVRK